VDTALLTPARGVGRGLWKGEDVGVTSGDVCGVVRSGEGDEKSAQEKSSVSGKILTEPAGVPDPDVVLDLTFRSTAAMSSAVEERVRVSCFQREGRVDREPRAVIPSSNRFHLQI